MKSVLWLFLAVGVVTGKSISEDSPALPQDNTEQSTRACQCEPRYFKHYEAKGCSPVYEDGCDCPVRFDCKPPDPAEDENVCYFDGKTYQKGEKVPSNNNCDICYCQESYSPEASAEITCIAIECPSMFGPPMNSSCYYVYESGQCCPEVKCSTDEVSTRVEKVCEVGGKTYKLGERIYPEEDPCLTCTCTQDWNGTQGGSCKTHNCMLGRKRRRFLEGCVPIYHEATCCPIEVYCGTPEEGFQNTTVPLADAKDIESGNACTFKGMNFKIGQTLDINHPTHCVTCTCSTPPDFTCVHQKCEGPPNNDYENCRSNYVPGTCCLTYECPQRSSPEFSSGNTDMQCTIPECEDGCALDFTTKPCPTCYCGNAGN